MIEVIEALVSGDVIQRLPQGELYKRLVRTQERLTSPPAGLVLRGKKTRAASQNNGVRLLARQIATCR